jgi:hypothetical protein
MAVEGGAAAVDKENDEQSTQLRRVRFRSYRPRDPELQKCASTSPSLTIQRWLLHRTSRAVAAAARDDVLTLAACCLPPPLAGAVQIVRKYRT